MIEGLYKFGEFFLGKNFLKGNTFKDFIRDGFRLCVFICLPLISVLFAMITTSIIDLLIGGKQ